MKEPIVALLLGRRGSKGLPGKNYMKILGRPALHYPILAAKNSKYITHIFVSTDDEEIAKTAEQFKLRIINRPDWLCTDDALFEDALVHGYNQVKKSINLMPKYVVILMCNAVTINSNLIMMFDPFEFKTEFCIGDW